MSSVESSLTEEQVQEIIKQAQSIRYGTLTLIFQDGHLIQIDRNEKIRLSEPPRTKKKPG
jgi:hypothetical protein